MAEVAADVQQRLALAQRGQGAAQGYAQWLAHA